MRLPDADVIFRAQEMGSVPQMDLNFEPSPVVTMIEEQNELLKKQNEQLASSNKELSQLLELKEKELENSKADAEKAKKYNTKMLVIALVSAGIALASFVATILIAVL